ncbi:MAG: hypothetical protein GY906_09570 [bacterium]|nr:hypothetical protein [bacterium]
MMTPEPSSGQLRARLDVPSHQLQRTMPIEVRDSRLALVVRVRHSETIDLLPGWYEVSAVLDDGKRHSETVQVTVGGREEVELRVDREELLPSNKAWIAGRGLLTFAGVGSVELVEVEGAELRSKSEEYWEFVPKDREPESMPWARLRFRDETLSVSLPVNPRGHGDLAACSATFAYTNDRFDVRAGFHHKRIVSTAILNMIDRGQFAHATRAAEQTAEDMLMSKYQDPVGAALGAIIMFRAGTLGTREGWLRNLTSDFDWLPDGKVLLAALPGAGDCEEKADLLLRASEQRLLFTESFSLLFDALRCWKSDHRRDEIDRALEDVGKVAHEADWNAFMLTRRER